MLAVSTAGEAMGSATQGLLVGVLDASSGPQEVRISKDRLKQLMARRKRKYFDRSRR